MSRPKYFLDGQEQERLVIIRTTYENAVSAGDKNVYFISGRELMAEALDNGTIDNTHPNDFGFYSMAKALGNVLEKIKPGGNSPIITEQFSCRVLFRGYMGCSSFDFNDYLSSNPKAVHSIRCLQR